MLRGRLLQAVVLLLASRIPLLVAAASEDEYPICANQIQYRMGGCCMPAGYGLPCPKGALDSVDNQPQPATPPDRCTTDSECSGPWCAGAQQSGICQENKCVCQGPDNHDNPTCKTPDATGKCPDGEDKGHVPEKPAFVPIQTTRKDGAVATVVLVQGGPITSPITLTSAPEPTLDISADGFDSTLSSISTRIASLPPLVSSWAAAPDSTKAISAVQAIEGVLPQIAEIANGLPDGQRVFACPPSDSSQKVKRQDADKSTRFTDALQKTTCGLLEVLGGLQQGESSKEEITRHIENVGEDVGQIIRVGGKDTPACDDSQNDGKCPGSEEEKVTTTLTQLPPDATIEPIEDPKHTITENTVTTTKKDDDDDPTILPVILPSGGGPPVICWNCVPLPANVQIDTPEFCVNILGTKVGNCPAKDKPKGSATGKPDNTATNNPVAKPTDHPEDKPTDKPIDASNKPTDNPGNQPTDHPVAQPTDVPGNKPKPGPVDTPKDNPGNKPNDEPLDKPDKESDKSTTCTTTVAATYASVFCSITGDANGKEPASQADCSTLTYSTATACEVITGSTTTTTTTEFPTPGICSPETCGGSTCPAKSDKRGLVKRKPETVPDPTSLPKQGEWFGPENYDNKFDFMRGEVAVAYDNPDARVNLTPLPGHQFTTGRFISFTNEVASLAVSGLWGCTAVVIVSKKGAWATHNWEGWIVDDFAWLEGQLISTPDLINRAAADLRYNDNTPNGLGHVFDDDQDPRVYVITRIGRNGDVRDESVMSQLEANIDAWWKRGNNGNAPQGQNFELITYRPMNQVRLPDNHPNLPGVEVGAPDQAKGDESDVRHWGDPEFFNFRGKVLIQYQPALRSCPPKTIIGKEKAAYRVWFLAEVIAEESWEGSPDQHMEVRKRAIDGSTSCELKPPPCKNPGKDGKCSADKPATGEPAPDKPATDKPATNEPGCDNPAKDGTCPVKDEPPNGDVMPRKKCDAKHPCSGPECIGGGAVYSCVNGECVCGTRPDPNVCEKDEGCSWKTCDEETEELKCKDKLCKCVEKDREYPCVMDARPQYTSAVCRCSTTIDGKSHATTTSLINNRCVGYTTYPGDTKTEAPAPTQGPVKEPWTKTTDGTVLAYDAYSLQSIVAYRGHMVTYTIGVGDLVTISTPAPTQTDVDNHGNGECSTPDAESREGLRQACNYAVNLFEDDHVYDGFTSRYHRLDQGLLMLMSVGQAACYVNFECEDYGIGMTGKQIREAREYAKDNHGIGACGHIKLSNSCEIKLAYCTKCKSHG